MRVFDVSKNRWTEIERPIIKHNPITPEYEALVEGFIREKYSISDELAINRQRDTKPHEFDEYYIFCEACKSKAREISGI